MKIKLSRAVLRLILCSGLVTVAATAQTKVGDPPPPKPPNPVINAILAGPVPANRTIQKNGICWAWASPCDGGCSSPSPSNQAGWRYATSGELAAKPLCSDFLDASAPGGFRCASSYFDPIYSHCDYGDCTGGYVTSNPMGDNWESWFVSDLTGQGVCGGSVATGCPAHTVHGHISSSPPDHFAGLASHAHQNQHGHHIPLVNGCPPTHAFGHSLGLTADGDLDFVAALNQEGNLAPARRGSVVQLFGYAAGLYVGTGDDNQSAGNFTPDASGSPLYFTTSLPRVRIAGLEANVAFSGLAPGLKGAWQINVVVPDQAPAGKLPVAIFYDGFDLRSVDIAVE